jgi:transcriptional regulator with XRE-family HTH domain
MRGRASSRLAAYLKERELSPADFAKAIGANRSQVYRLLTGERGPSVDLAARIEETSGGAIKAADWAGGSRSLKRKRATRARHARSSLNHESAR